jgi:hypothetical protein
MIVIVLSIIFYSEQQSSHKRLKHKFISKFSNFRISELLSESSASSTEFICVFHMVPTINSNCFSKQY